MPSIARNKLAELIARYQSQRIDASRLSGGLQEAYWNIDFLDDTEKRAFFDHIFQIEQVVASNIDSIDALGRRDVDIIAKAIDNLLTFCLNSK